MPPHSVRFGDAVGRGLKLAWRSPGIVGLAFVAEVGSGLLTVGAGASVAALAFDALVRSVESDPWRLVLDPGAAARSLLGQLIRGHALMPLLGALLTAALISGVLRLLWFTLGARAFGIALAGEGPTRPSAAAQLANAAALVALFVPVEAAALLYNVTALGAGGIAYIHALMTKSGSGLGSASLALAMVLSLVVSLAKNMLFRLALIRAVAGDAGPLDAVVAAARIVATRAGTLVGLGALFSFFEGVARVIGGSGGVLFVGHGVAAVATMLYARAATGLVGALLAAFVSTARLGALATIDAGDRGVLPDAVPPPPSAGPVHRAPLTAEPVIESVSVSDLSES